MTLCCIYRELKTFLLFQLRFRQTFAFFPAKGDLNKQLIQFCLSDSPIFTNFPPLMQPQGRLVVTEQTCPYDEEASMSALPPHCRMQSASCWHGCTTAGKSLYWRQGRVRRIKGMGNSDPKRGRNQWRQCH